MNRALIEQFKQKLEWVLDEQFPKGECKERGNALVLYAQSVILFERCLKYTSQDDSETTLKPFDGDHYGDYLDQDINDKCKCDHERQWHDHNKECRVDIADDSEINCDCEKFQEPNKKGCGMKVAIMNGEAILCGDIMMGKPRYCNHCNYPDANFQLDVIKSNCTKDSIPDSYELNKSKEGETK